MSFRVLLADDHTILREGLSTLLAAQPKIEVVGAVDNGKAVVQQAREKSPDVIVMDISMPELNGTEALRQIRQEMSNIKVIMLSMHRTPQYIIPALQAGAAGYLLKDSAITEIVTAIEMVMEGKRYLSQEVAEVFTSSVLELGSIEAAINPLEALSEREREILQLVVEGNTTQEIADLLSLSTRTVDTYRSRLMQKVGINNLPDLVRFAIRHGISSLE